MEDNFLEIFVDIETDERDSPRDFTLLESRFSTHIAKCLLC